jgi:hypothetical protein
MADTKPDLDELIAWATAVISEGLLSPDLHKTGRILLNLDVDPPLEPKETPRPV